MLNNISKLINEAGKLDITLNVKIDEKQFAVMNAQINAIRKLIEKYGSLTENYAERVLKEASTKSDKLLKKVK
jgi:hypothetical protein